MRLQQALSEINEAFREEAELGEIAVELRSGSKIVVEKGKVGEIILQNEMLINQVGVLEGDKGVFCSRLDELNSKLNASQESIRLYEDSISQLNMKLNEATLDRDTLKSSLERAERERDEARSTLRAEMGRSEQLNSFLRNKEKEWAQKEIEWRAYLESYTRELEKLKAFKDSVDEIQEQEIQEIIKKNKEKLEGVESAAKEMKKEIELKEEMIETLKRELQRSKLREDSFLKKSLP
jgi:chromosome segregation ATPase